MSLQMLNKQRLNFLWHVLRLILVAGGWTAVAVYQLSAVTAVKLYAGVSIVAYLTLLFLIHRNVVGDMETRTEGARGLLYRFGRMNTPTNSPSNPASLSVYS